MSNPIAIAAVTATLQALLGKGVVLGPNLDDTTVTTLPPDRARGTNGANQLNLFLYQTVLNAAWRNADMPRQIQPGESGNPPLALNLYYLLTAYGRDNDVAQPFSHHVLGQAMSILHDHPVLSGAEIKAATAAALPDSDLDLQIERVRITPQPLSVEEISKLWTGFQTQYRLSTAYEAAVVLIESSRASRAPLPVLMRGPGDRGARAQADLIPPFPFLESATPPNKQPSARVGELVALKGFHLDGSNIRVLFNSPRLSNPIPVPPEPNGTSTDLSVGVPDQPAGICTLAVLVRRPDEPFERSTNELPFSLAPRITNFAPPNPAQRDAQGNLTLTLTVSPEVLPGQRAALLVGETEFIAQPHVAPIGTLIFNLSGLKPGGYYLRLRVDGVDSLLVNRATVPPSFDQTQKLVIT